MGLAPILVETIFDIIKDDQRTGHDRAARRAERPDGPGHRQSRLRPADWRDRAPRRGLGPRQEPRRSQCVPRGRLNEASAVTQTSRVNGPSSPFDGLSAKVITGILIAILVAIVKPWGGDEGVRQAAASQAPASETPSALPSVFAGRLYDPETFGLYEPWPRWELWPAGYLTSFGFAMRIDSGPAATTGPTGSAPSSGPSQPTPSRAPEPTDAPEPMWPAAITVGAGSHLSMIGINTPLGYEVADFLLTRLDGDGTVTTIPTTELLSPWPAHFTVIALGVGQGTDRSESWPVGHYRLSLVIQPRNIERSIDIFVNATGGPSVTRVEPSPPL